MPSQARVPRRRCRVPGQFPCASPNPKAQSPSPAPAAPPRQPRLMIHSCGSEAVNHRSPSPSCESPAVLTRVVIYLRRAVQSGSPGAVSGKRLRLKCYTISLSGTRDRHWWQPKGCCGPPSPQGGNCSRLTCHIPPGQQQGCAGHWCSPVSRCSSCHSELPCQK